MRTKDTPHNALEELQKEYDAFVYAVSHDYSAPLRHIENYTRFLLEDIKNPTDDMHEYMGYIETSLNRITLMQNALLDISRLKTDKALWKTLDSNTIVSDVIKQLSDSHDLSLYGIKTHDLPPLHGDHHLIHTNLYHLLDNAIKFSAHNTGKKHITIAGKETDNAALITITDDGVGIAEQNQDNAFLIFKRLHPQDYGGIGAGLTIARKIVQLHDGKIWIEQPETSGAQICFSIPRHGV